MSVSKSENPSTLSSLAPTLGQGLLAGFVGGNDDPSKMPDHPPSWVRFVSGSLGFFTSLLSLAIPAIILLIIDRLIPSENVQSLWSLFGLGIGVAVSVCLVDLMRMRALERYFTNVRGLVLYQDSCFALFWIFTLAFLHPILPIIPLIAGGALFLMWAFRRNRKVHNAAISIQQDMDPVLVDAVGLGPAYIQKSAQGEISAEEQPDFQTVGQTAFLNLVQFVTLISTITLAAYLHIGGRITLGTMLAVTFLTQYIVLTLVRCYQVQSLKPARSDPSSLALGQALGEATRVGPPSADDEMVMLSIEEVEDFGFAAFSADLFQGLCLAVIGPSGSGKSELLRALATGQFYEGKITYRGRNWGRNHGRLHPMSYAPPTPIALKGTLVENVTCFDPKASTRHAIELVRKLDPYEDVFGDLDFLNDKIEQNFSAQGQIISLARAFWQNSEIIILDTPETYLDKASRSALLALILQSKTEGKIVIIATDDDYLMHSADEVVKMERGEITDRGPMDEVLTRYHQRWVRVSFSPTKRDAFRLSMWLEAQFPMGMPDELRARVKQAAQDMLFLAPRDPVMGQQDEVLFDVRMTPYEVHITMHDRGDLVVSDHLEGDLLAEYDRVETAADGFEQTLREGYRQFAVRFAADRAAADEPLVSEA